MALSRDVNEEIKWRLRKQGLMTFAEFHYLALYWPNGGYYTSRNPVGADGDFYTAPHTHPIFGKLIIYFTQWLWEALYSPSQFWILELGAGNGRLAEDALVDSDFLKEAFMRAFLYIALDVQPYTRAHSTSIQRIQSNALPVRSLTGFVLANELIDAMPVHRVTMINGDLREIYVAMDQNDQFVEVIDALSTPQLANRFTELNINLPEGHRTEINLGLDDWFADLASSIGTGYVLLIDYGYTAEDFYSDKRKRGTLNCYYHHTIQENPYRHIGFQDISVHVEFTSVMRAAKQQGFKVIAYTTQAEFLTKLGIANYRNALTQMSDISLVARQANIKGFDTLIDPEGMGEFKVLLLGKDAPDICLSDLDSYDGHRGNGIESEKIPLLESGHLFSRSAGLDMPDLPSWHDLIT